MERRAEAFYMIKNPKIGEEPNFVKTQRGPKTVEKCKFDLNLLANVIRKNANILFPLNKIPKLILNWM